MVRAAAIAAVRAVLAEILRSRVRWSAAPVGLALCYHAVADRAGDPARELDPAVSAAALRAQLRHLRRRFRVVPAAALPAAAAHRRRGARIPVAVTFDDDLPSHVSHALPALGNAGVRATFFLTGSGLDGGGSPWWPLLQRAWNGGLVDDALLRTTGLAEAAGRPRDLRHAAATVQAMSPRARDAATAALRARVGDGDERPIGAEGIAALRAAGHDVGFHTRRHDDLRGLADPELATAMTAGRAALERAAGSSTSAIAYPHGSADARVAGAARAAGFATGFTTDPAPVTRRADPLLLGRVYPAPGAQGRFALELSRTLSRALRVTGA